MSEYQARLIERLDRSKTVSSFRWLVEPPMEFCAGQFVEVIFDQSNRKNKDFNKYLSLSCRPGKGFIELTKRKTESEFSRKLWGLKKNDSVILQGPMGSCIFDRAFQKIGFLIGGIGITPVISMLEHIVFNNLAVDACLIYSNLYEDDVPFRAELDLWRQENKNLRVVYTIAQEEPQNKEYFKGIITEDMVRSHMQDFIERTFFISGPVKMVEAIKTICQNIGCDMKKIKTENFVGYE